MSVAEIIKTALPVAAPQNEGPNIAQNNTPVKPNINVPPPANTPVRGRPPRVHTPSSISSDKAEPAISALVTSKSKVLPKSPEEFYKDLHQFHERRGTPITRPARITGKPIDLHALYSEVTERGGFNKVNGRDEWDEIVPVLNLNEKCVNITAALKHIYRRFLEKYERLTFFGEDPDKVEALEANDHLESTVRGGRHRYPSTLSNTINSINVVPMSYNYRQHIINMDRRNAYNLSTDLHKKSPLEKLMLTLISPLPNEQDFGINACTLMSNESKHTLKLNEYPKLLDILLAHIGIFPDVATRELFEHVYTKIRQHSLFSFWRDLLFTKPQILELYVADDKVSSKSEAKFMEIIKPSLDDDYLNLDFLNLGRGLGTQDYVGQRVQQVVTILRNLSFFEENIYAFAKNRTFIRFLVMGVNIRWGNVHSQVLDIAGNVANELELQDPTTDELSRYLMATVCDGIESSDRGVIISCLEILYKLCQKDSNEDHIARCVNVKLFETVCHFLSLNDIMLLIFSLESIYALSSLGVRTCNMIMQVRGLVDQLVSLITIEAQSYGAEGCVLMRVVETVPGNMLPIVAQNIANMQNVAQIQKQQQVPTPVMPLVQPQHLVLSQDLPMLPQPIIAQPALPQPQAQQVLNSADLTTQVVQQQSPTQTTQPQSQLKSTAATPMPQATTSFTHEDEQYALAWLSATFERASSVDSHVENQELYRMYLTHCQKSGKHSVVNHVQFPRLVRLIFNNSVGPVTVRRPDGTELNGLHYVNIRLRAQPLPIQSKTQFQQKNANNEQGSNAAGTSVGSARKIKRIIKSKTQQGETQQQTSDILKHQQTTSEVMTLPTVAAAKSQESTATQLPPKKQESVEQSEPIINLSEENIAMEIDTELIKLPVLHVKPGSGNQQQQTIILTETPSLVTNSSTNNQQQQPSSSLIKSLLATKVTQRQQKQKDQITTTVVSSAPPALVPSTVTTAGQSTQPIKVASTAISALVNNPLMQNTPVKVGQTTIKPLNPHSQQIATITPNLIEKKQIIMESAPPPLAPLSGNNVVKDSSGRPVILANQMLVEILDKKNMEPPTTIIKRKLDDSSNSSTEGSKRFAYETAEEPTVTPSKNAANLYAEMAASILEDEDLDDIPPLPTNIVEQQTVSTPSLVISAGGKIQQSTNVANVQRQLVFQTNQMTTPTPTPSPGPQIKLASSTSTTHNQMPTAVATIKTEHGLQTVPLLVQQKPSIEHQTPQTQIIQQVLQPTVSAATVHMAQPTTTQYVLATNAQGQTYLVAQQTPQSISQPAPQAQQQPTQTLLLTQTPQQQSQGTKTIIILQQQTLPTQQQQLINTVPVTHGGGCGQKMIMTTSQGQQVLVTQRPKQQQQQLQLQPQQQQQQIIINPQLLQRQIIQSPALGTSIQMQQQQQSPQQQLQLQPGTERMSPSLLSQLNHIPATIKLHQPQPQQAPVSRLNKSIAIVQTTPTLSTSSALTTPQLPTIHIPQLQQHQSIIQQHIISGPSEKRQVMLSGGRTIEIKETLITTNAPQPPPLQQSQLNSQTIITKQPSSQVQQQPQIRTVIEQQHPSIIQQKITLPVSQQQATQQQKLISQKVSEQQAALPTKPILQSQTIIPAPQQQQTQLPTIKKVTTQVTSSGTVRPQLQQTKMSPKAALPIKQTFSNTEPPPLLITSGGSAAPSQQADAGKVIKNDDTIKNQTASSIVTTSATTTNSTVAVASNLPTTSTITSNTSVTSPAATSTIAAQQQQLPTNVPVDPNWLFVCDWRNCPRRKFKSMNDLQHHACIVHCPDHLDAGAEIFCQWGPGFCDGIPRKRYSLMTHLIDRHLTVDSLRAAVQRRIASGVLNTPPPPNLQPVTIVRNVAAAEQQQQQQSQRSSSASPALSTSSSSSSLPPTPGTSALQAIKRHNSDFLNSKELMDENEGPVTKSIRLTAALILRNLVTFSSTAKRSLRRYEPHLANVALSNVESSVALSHILSELSN